MNLDDHVPPEEFLTEEELQLIEAHQRRRRRLLIGLVVCILGGAVLLGWITLQKGQQGFQGSVDSIERINQLRREGQYRSAAIHLQRQLKNSPSNAALRLLAGQNHLELLDARAAELSFLRAFELGNSEPELIIGLARAEALQGRNPEAMTRLNGVPGDAGGQRAEALSVRAMIRANEGRTEEARALFEQALTENPTLTTALVGLASLAAGQGRWDEAAALSLRARQSNRHNLSAKLLQASLLEKEEKPEEAAELYRETLREQPKAAAARLGLARVQAQQELLDEALETLQPFTGRHLPPGAALLKASILVKQGRLEDARTTLEQGLNSAPEHPGLLLQMGIVLRSLGNQEGAESALAKAYRLAPEEPRVAATYAHFLESRGQKAKALRIMDNSRRQELAGSKDSAQLAALAAIEGRLDDARQLLLAALERQPGDRDLTQRLALLELQMGRTDAAVQRLRALSDTAEPDPSVVSALLAGLLSKAQWTQADAVARAWLEREPDSIGALVSVSLAARGRGDLLTAEDYADRARSLEPQTNEEFLNLAELERMAGRPLSATAIYLRMLDQDPDNWVGMLALANLAAETGQAAEQRGWLERATRAAPEQLSPASALAALYLGGGEAGKALEVLRPWISDNTPPRIAILAARAHLLLGQGEPARNLLEAVAGDSNASVEVWRLLLFSYATDSLWLKAQRAAERALAADPNALAAPGFATVYARTLAKLGNRAQARGVLEELLARDPGAVSARFMLASLMTEDGDIGAAREQIQAGVEYGLDPQRVEVSLGLLDLRSGALQEAARQFEAAVARSPSAYTPTALLVQSYLRMGDTEAAVAAARNLRNEQPESAQSEYLLGATLLDAGALDQAAIHLQRASDMDPDATQALLGLGLIMEQRTHLDEARRLYERVVAAEPDNVNGLMGLSRVALRQNDAAGALELARSGWEASSGNPLVGLTLARLLLLNERTAEALTLADQIGRANPDEPVAQAIKGRAQMQLGRNADALQTLRPLNRDHPENWETWGLQALAASRLGHHDETESALARALALNPSAEHLWELRTRNSLALGRPDEAARHADQYARLRPEGSAAKVLKGDILASQGDLEAAIELWRDAQLVEPSAMVALRLADAYRQIGDAKAEALVLAEQVQRNPDSAQLRARLGATLAGRGDFTQAVGHLEWVVARNPNDGDAINNLAWSYLEMGDERALEYAKRAFTLAPENPDVADTYGWALVRAGRVGQGQFILAQAARADPESPYIRYHLAAARARAGERDQAQRELKALLESRVAFSHREEAEQLLRELSTP